MRQLAAITAQHRIVNILFIFFIVYSLAGCKTSRKATSSKPVSDKVSVVFDADEGRNISERKNTSEKSTKVTARPAREYYGEDWNTEHVRYSSAKPSGTATLDMNPSGTNGFVMPVCGKVLSEFGPRNGSMHTGIDLKLEMNDPVYCAFDGTVRMAKEYGGYGKMVVIRHDNGLETVYGHLNNIAVKTNQSIKAGDRVGGGGKTGRATGVHLHFETRFQGEPFNPRLAVNFETCKLQSQALVLNEDSYKRYYKQMELAGKKTTPKAEPKTEQPVVQMAKTTINIPKPTEHVVEKGDTLYNISQRYGTTVDSLRKLNQLSESSVLQVGQKIIVDTTK